MLSSYKNSQRILLLKFNFHVINIKNGFDLYEEYQFNRALN